MEELTFKEFRTSQNIVDTGLNFFKKALKEYKGGVFGKDHIKNIEDTIEIWEDRKRQLSDNSNISIEAMDGLAELEDDIAEDVFNMAMENKSKGKLQVSVVKLPKKDYNGTKADRAKKRVTSEEFAYFLEKIDFGKSTLDNKAIEIMNRFDTLFYKDEQDG